MELLTNKLDYELYFNLFVKKDLEEAKKLWKAICQSPVFLWKAVTLQSKADGKVLCFTAPTICFMILKFPNDVDKDIYEVVVDALIKSPNVVSSLSVGKSAIDFLDLIMRNKDLELNDYQKELIIDKVRRNYGVEEYRVDVSYNELLDFEAPVVARFKNEMLDISVNEYEKVAFDNDEVLVIEKLRRYKTPDDYRSSILDNGNFSIHMKDIVASRIAQDEHEFIFLINYFIRNMADDNAKNMTLEELRNVSYEELAKMYQENEDIFRELQFVKQLLDEHYQKESSLVRSVN